MKRFLMTMALACVLSSSALAGDIPSGGAPSPAPNELTQTTKATSPGEVQTSDWADQLSEGALSALLTVLGLLAV
jgi:opacity protein-like surface antigen